MEKKIFDAVEVEIILVDDIVRTSGDDNATEDDLV